MMMMMMVVMMMMMDIRSSPLRCRHAQIQVDQQTSCHLWSPRQATTGSRADIPAFFAR
jgi:hypothetical protein